MNLKRTILATLIAVLAPASGLAPSVAISTVEPTPLFPKPADGQPLPQQEVYA